MAGTSFNITVVHKNWTWVYNIQTTSAKFQALLSLVQGWWSDPWSIGKVSWSDWTWNEVWFSLTDWWNAVDLDASIYTIVGWSDTTIYALYPEPETITGFYLDWTKYEFSWWWEESNTKTFCLSSSSDLTTAQAVLDWSCAWKYPYISYCNREYLLTSNGSAFLTFCSLPSSYTDCNSCWYTYNQSCYIYLYKCNDWCTAKCIVVWPAVFWRSYLAPNTNYTTPYIPQYDWSPATKKYVDDKMDINIRYVIVWDISTWVVWADWSDVVEAADDTWVTVFLATGIYAGRPYLLSDFTGTSWTICTATVLIWEDTYKYTLDSKGIITAVEKIETANKICYITEEEYNCLLPYSLCDWVNYVILKDDRYLKSFNQIIQMDIDDAIEDMNCHYSDYYNELYPNNFATSLPSSSQLSGCKVLSRACCCYDAYNFCCRCYENPYSGWCHQPVYIVLNATNCCFIKNDAYYVDK